MTAYLELLRLPGARSAALPAACARLAVTMIMLALLFVMLETGHSYGLAGGVSGAYAAGLAVGSPVLGRMMDRLGATPVLWLGGVAATLILTAVAALAGAAPAGVLLGMAFGAGVTTVPVGASMRALWPRLTDDRALRQRAYAFEATLSELLFIAGPALVTLLAALAGPRAALLVTAILLGGGAVGYAQAGAVRHIGSRPDEGAAASAASVPALSRSRVVAAVVVLVAIALTAALSTAMVVAVTAVLPAQGMAPTWAGVMVALQSVGSVVGGLMYGARQRSGAALSRYLRLLLILSIGLAALPVCHLAYHAGVSAVGSVVLLGAVLLLSGIPIAPTGSEEFQLFADMTTEARMTQAFAGIGSFIGIGSAMGSAVAGFVADRFGPTAALVLPAGFVVAALLLVLATRSTILAATSERMRSAKDTARLAVEDNRL